MALTSNEKFAWLEFFRYRMIAARHPGPATATRGGGDSCGKSYCSRKLNPGEVGRAHLNDEHRPMSDEFA